jgi:regulatory protein
VKRIARPVTPASLQNAASHYLERYATTAEGLRRILERRVVRAKMLDAPVVDAVDKVIDVIVAKYVHAGLVDDQAFAQTKARALHRRGTSSRLIRQKLRLAGVDGDTLDRAMVGLDEELHASPATREETAALALARRRRLGPFRSTGRQEHRARDLAAMARAGFDYDVARRVIDAHSSEALDEE